MYTVTISKTGQTFQVAAGETILTAALRQQLVLPYGCKTGACGACKGTVVQGQVDHGQQFQEKALTLEERAAGKALFCQATACSDLTIDARVIGSGDIQIKTLPCRVQKLERLADDVIRLELKLPANETLKFFAGQYLDFILRDGTRRSFSMANAPHADGFIEIHVRHVPGGQFTDHVFSKLKEKDILRFEAPMGTFFLREENHHPIIFVASGTGFAPIKAIIEHMQEKNIQRPAVLYWGGRRPHDLYMHQLAETWAAQGKLRYVPVISEATSEDAWQGRTGFVHQAVMQDFPDLSTYEVYACGVPVMVEAAQRDFIAQCKLPEAAFYADSFTTAADLAR